MNIFLIAAQAFPDSIRKKIKFLILSFFYGRDYLQRFEEIFISLGLNKILLDNPRQYGKIFRPYLRRGLKVSERILYIRNHYEVTKKYWNENLIKSVYYDRKLVLCGCQESIFVALSRGRGYEKEGEVSLGIFNPQKVLSINFNFLIDKNAKNEILIGCMQAASNSGLDTQENIRNLTKKMHGMRPQAILIAILSEIAILHEVKKISAINALSHVRGKRIKTNLDAFWRDLGGGMVEEGLYSLPISYQRKKIESVPSKKRSMYKKRYLMLDDLLSQVRRVFLENLNFSS